MRAVLKLLDDYLTAELAELGGIPIGVYRDYVYGVTAPYVVLQAPSLPVHDEECMAGPQPDEPDGFFRVTSVHATTDGARFVADRVRSVLSPGLAPLAIAGGLQVVWSEALGDVVVDRDVTLPNTNQHPAVVIEEYEFTTSTDES
jgi:hypothetical protein